VPAIPALPPTPMPRMASVPALTSPGEETREPRELGFRIKPKARPVRQLRDLPPWARKVLIGVAVVAFYFGARALNRYRVSFAARDAAIEALIPLLGLEQARVEAGRQHGACFDKGYRASWGKWQDFSFDQGKHAQCVVASVMFDLSRRRQATARVALAAEAARRPPSVATRRPPPPAPPRTPPPTFGRVAVGNAKVLQMARSPQMSGHVSFVAIGNAEALAAVATCSYTVTCDGQPVGLPAGQRALAPCPLKVQGASATGDLAFSMLAPAPAEGDCGLELTLTDGTRPLSATVVVPLS
jgi:hypothetical protein